MSASTAGQDGVPIAMWPALLGLVRRWAVAEFRIDGEPVSWQRPGRNTETNATYTQKKTRDGKKTVAEAFAAARPGFVVDPDTAFGLYVGLRSRRVVRADVDNMVKLIMDALNKICWDDDRQVAELLTRIDRGVDDTPHTAVIIYRASNNVHRTPRTRRPRPAAGTIRITPMIQRRTFNVLAGQLAAGNRPTLSSIAIAAGLRTAADAGEVIATLVAAGLVDYQAGHRFTILKPFARESIA